VRRAWTGLVTSPARLLPATFLAAIAAGTGLLMMPAARAGAGAADAVTALFTATSAVCVTGLTVVDTGTYWSAFGQLVILLLILVGGLGITALATLIVLSVAGRLGLRSRLAAAQETRTSELSDVRRVLVRVGATMLTLQVAVATVLALRLLVAYDNSPAEALREGVFHAVSASNNAGFSLYPDNLTRFVGDPVIMLTVCGAVIVGGIGFPVILELYRRWRRPRKWSVHTRLTIWATVTLLALGLLTMVLFEWNNPDTLGALSSTERPLAAIFQAVQPRTAGFNVVPVEDMRQESLLATVGLMFIGGGSAGTAGGIKVTTAAVLLFVVWAEIRGNSDVTVSRRRIASRTQRQAVGIAAVGALGIGVGAMVIMTTTRIDFGPAVFEAASAFGTVGLSLGFDADLPLAAKLTLVVLMFIGRVGPVAAFSFFALRTTQVRYRYPEARPLVG
jgi:trk system potassium uptake protein TrkH